MHIVFYKIIINSEKVLLLNMTMQLLCKFLLVNFSLTNECLFLQILAQWSI